jgi:Tfp pilus assembly protein PilN
MRALNLDLVRRPAAWPAWLLLLVGAVLAGDAAFDTLRLRDELDALQHPRARAEKMQRVAAPPLDEATRRELDAARQALQELALPWDTAPLAIEPDAGKLALRLAGEARDYPAVLALIARLEASQTLTGVHLQSHALREDAAERPVQFTLSASWRAAP